MMQDKDLYQQVLTDPTRLRILRDLELVDSPTEAAFNRLTQLASKILNVPVSLVSIVDADRQFFKSFFGLGEPWASRQETPLSHSFCQHVVVSGDPLVVEDAREHPLVKDNLAIPDLNVIGYLGMPLTTSDGYPLGSFCVIDTKPHQWTDHEIEVVRELAVSVMTEIELRNELKARLAAEAELKKYNQRLRRVMVFCRSTIDHMRDVVKHNAPVEEMLVYLSNARSELDRVAE